MLPPHRPFKDKPVRKTKLQKPKKKTPAITAETVAVTQPTSALARALSPKRLIVAPSPGTGAEALRSVKSRAITG